MMSSVKLPATITAISAVTLASCGTSATLQERAGDAVASHVTSDRDLSDVEFDEGCLQRTALGLTDEIAQDVVQRDGDVDLDVDDNDRDDVYDFYNCADERDLARLIQRESRVDIDARCLEELFENTDAGAYLDEADGSRAGRFGDFDQVVSCSLASPEVTAPPATAAPATPPPATAPPTTPPPTTTPPTTTPPTTAPPTTAPPATAPPTTAPPTTVAIPDTPRPMSDTNTGAEGFGEDAATFLNDDAAVQDAVGGDVTSTFCFTPSNTDIGTRFLCFGAATNFGSIEFEVEITGSAEYLVQDFRVSLSADRLLVFIVLDAAFETEDLGYDQRCVRDFLAVLPDDQVTTIFDDTADMNSIAGLAPCIVL